MRVEAASGVVMLVAAVAALVWANSGLRSGYETLWATQLQVRLGDLVDLDLTLRAWVNDAAMALFFLLAGLEIKRQLLLGELRNPRAAALPALAALGGMVVPALIFLAVNAGGAGSRGWGIPVATDIAFAVGRGRPGRQAHPARCPHLHPHPGRGRRRRRHRRDRRVLRRVGQPGLARSGRGDRGPDAAPSRRRRPLARALHRPRRAVLVRVPRGRHRGGHRRRAVRSAHAHPALPRPGPVRTDRARPRRPDRGDLRRPGAHRGRARAQRGRARGPGAVRQRDGVAAGADRGPPRPLGQHARGAGVRLRQRRGVRRPGQRRGSRVRRRLPRARRRQAGGDRRCSRSWR